MCCIWYDIATKHGFPLDINISSSYPGDHSCQCGKRHFPVKPRNMETQILSFRAGPKISELPKKEQLLIRDFFPKTKNFFEMRIKFRLPFRDLSLPGKWEALQALLVPGKLNMGHNRLNKTDFLFLSSFPPFLTPTHLLPPGVVDDEGVHPESQNLTKTPWNPNISTKWLSFSKTALLII